MSKNNKLFEVSGTALPDDAQRICPLIGNSELKLIVDGTGAMHDFTPTTRFQQTPCWPKPRIVWAGRRHNRRPDRYNSNLFEWGFLELRLIGEDALGAVTSWKQRLVPREGLIETETSYGDAAMAATSFVHLDRNLIVFHRHYRNLPADRAWTIEATYALCHEGVDELPFHVTWQTEEPQADGVTARTLADGLLLYHGQIALFADRPGQARAQGNRLHLRVPLDGNGQATIYLAMADDLGDELPRMPSQSNDWMSPQVRAVNDELLATPLNKPDPVATIAELRRWAAQAGYEAVLKSHQDAWTAFYAPVRVRLPQNQPKLAAALDTALYTLRCSWTRYSVPVGAFNSAWGAGYFASDGSWSIEALLGLGLFDLPRQTIEWQRRCLPFAAEMTAGSGARYMHAVNEGGALLIERNHMNFNQWCPLGQMAHYLTEYCRRVDTQEAWRRLYPIIREIAEFYRYHLLIKLPGRGAMTAATDVEGSGPRQDMNTDMAGAAFTMAEVAAWAERIGEDADLVDTWRELAEDVLASYQAMTGRNIPLGTGAFYLDFDLHKQPDKTALLDPEITRWREAERQRMIKRRPATTNICGEKAIPKLWPWNLQDRAFGEATLGHAESAASLLAESVNVLLDFSALYESGVLGPGSAFGFSLVQMPWFTTSSGAYIRALVRMLAYCQGDTVELLPGVPGGWDNLSFTLPIHHAGVIHLELEGGKLKQLHLEETQARPHGRLLRLPKRILDDRILANPNIEVVEQSETTIGIRVSSRGKTVIC